MSTSGLTKALGEEEATAAIRVLARLARVAEQTCQGAGISLPQYRLLVSVSGRPQRASELAASVGVSRPTLTSLVDGLEGAGLLKRVPVPTDRRGIMLELTPAGREAIAGAERALIRRIGRLVNGDAESAMGPLRDLVAGLARALDREREVAIGG
ncbi:MAG: MarR family winged helix-turn-helix transcriptional regulator [Myxococcota bacterium]